MLVNDVHLPRNEGQPCAALFDTSMYVLPGKCGSVFACASSPGMLWSLSTYRVGFFWCRGWPTFLEKCLSMTNISRKMSVDDQHFFKNVCQWPTFLEKCLSMTDISWKMSVNHQHIGSWLMTFIFPCTFTHLYECFSFKVCVCDLLVGLTRRSISPRLFSLPRLTNISWKNVCHWPTFLL